MEWLFSLALLPLLMCGAMCVGGALLAVLGIRRAQRPTCSKGTKERAAPDEDAVERV